MKRRLKKGWYLVTLNEGEGMNYIVYAFDYHHVNSVFANYSKSFEVETLTWRRIHGLTGCLIPSNAELGEFANGDLAFGSGRFHFVMTAVDD